MNTLLKQTYYRVEFNKIARILKVKDQELQVIILDVNFNNTCNKAFRLDFSLFLQTSDLAEDSVCAVPDSPSSINITDSTGRHLHQTFSHITMALRDWLHQALCSLLSSSWLHLSSLLFHIPNWVQAVRLHPES